jgi:hypothetical protein
MRHRMASTSEFTKGARRFAYAPCVVLAPVQRSLGQTCRAAFRPLVRSGKSSGLKAALRGMACISVVSIATARRFQTGLYESYGLSHQIACHPERPRSGRRDLLFRRNGERQIPPRASPSFGMTSALRMRGFFQALRATRVGCDEAADVAGFRGAAFGLTRATAVPRSPTASASTTGSAPCRRTTRSARADTPAARGAHRRWSPSESAPCSARA